LTLHESHLSLGAQFTNLNGAEAVANYGDKLAEHEALHSAAGILDLSFRNRLCLTGADRVRFLHGQVTNDIKRLRPGEGCYAAVVTAKGRMESDLNVYCLPDELLLDFEPGLAGLVSERLSRYIVADDVQVVDVAPLYGLLSVQGPQADAVIGNSGLPSDGLWAAPPQGPPSEPFASLKLADPTLGEIYLVNQPRMGTVGFDLFVPEPAMSAVLDKLVSAAQSIGGRPCGWEAAEIARIEAGLPRFGTDMDETNFPQECGIESRAVSYTKGCYVGQEVLNRLHTLGHVNRQLRGLRLADGLKRLPARGAPLFLNGREVGHITSAVASPTLKANIALGYVRREADVPGAGLVVKTGTTESSARLAGLPFSPQASPN
jgi:folate-binding protein YgfZ